MHFILSTILNSKEIRYLKPSVYIVVGYLQELEYTI